MNRNAKFILNIVIVVLVVGLLAGGIYFLTRHNEQNPSLGEMYTDDDRIKVYSYAGEELTGADIVNEYGSYSLSKVNGVWSMAGFGGETLNSKALDTLVNTFSEITSETSVEKDPQDPGVYGLDSPSAVMTLTTTGGKRTFYIGNKTPDASGYYFNTDASSDVYIMESYKVDVIRLTARNYLTVAEGLTAESITAVRIQGPGGTLSLSMNAVGPRDQYGLLSYWDITEPEVRGASNNEVTNRILTPLSQLEDTVSGALELNDENLASSGLNSPEYTVTVTSGGKTFTYEFSAVSGEYRFFRRGDVNYIMRSDADDCSFLQTGVYDVAENMLAMIDISLVSEIHVENEGETLSFDIVDGGGENPGFYHDGMQIDADTFRKDFYSHIVAIPVSGMVPRGSEPDQAESYASIEYVLTDGETIRLDFAPYDERNCAVVVNRAETYTVAQKTVDAIFDAVKNFK